VFGSHDSMRKLFQNKGEKRKKILENHHAYTTHRYTHPQVHA
jgi:hypothetical protein